MTNCNIQQYTNKYTGEAVTPYCTEHFSDADFGATQCYFQKGFEKGRRVLLASLSLGALLEMDLSDPLVIEAIAQKKDKSPVTFVEKLEESRK